MKAVADQAVEAYVEYGTSSGAYAASTTPSAFSDGVIEVDIDGLTASTRYYYRLRYRVAGSGDDFVARTEHSVVTQRAADSTFTFDVQSDSHQGYAAFYTSALYGVTMQNILNDRPDLLFDLGDAVSEDDKTETQDVIRQKYQNQRSYFDIVGHSTSVFLVLGNHEREEGWYLDDFGADRSNTRPVLGANARKRFFLNPVPNDFYSGNGEEVPELDGDHLRGDYYAFEWGSALFVALDPFWYTLTKPYAGAQGGEVDDATEVIGTRWDWTLGKAQYDWLAQTLAASTKPFKFVFAHHPTGGTSDYVRGGAKGAKYCEWGGYDSDGTTYSFATQRPGWAMPVHQLLVANGVTAFIHGHDHVFAKEELDGIIYQEVPQPADSQYGTGFSSNAEDYAGATTLHNSGHLRFTVSPVAVQVDYVRAFLQGDGENGSVAYTYTISPCAAVTSDGRACDDGDACTSGDACASGACVGTPTSTSCTAGGRGVSGGGASAGAAGGGGAGGQANEAGEGSTAPGNPGETDGSSVASRGTTRSSHGSGGTRGGARQSPPAASGSTSEAAAGEATTTPQGGESSGGRAGDEVGGTRGVHRPPSPIQAKSSGCGCVVARDSHESSAASLGVLLVLASAARRRRSHRLSAMVS